MIQKTEMRLSGKRLTVLCRIKGHGEPCYIIPEIGGNEMSLEHMQRALGELLDDIYALAYMSVDGEAYCSPLIRDFEEGGKDARRAIADGADGD